MTLQPVKPITYYNLQLVIPIINYTFNQLRPVTSYILNPKSSPARDSVAGPVVEVLVSDDTFDALVVHIRRRFFNTEAFFCEEPGTDVVQEVENK